MKVDYFYDEQFRRVLMHLIRVFGEFQVQNGVDDNFKQKYRKVPCLYGDMSRQTQYTIALSENILKSAPFMTISVKSFQMDRESIRSPVSQDIVMGTNKQNPDGSFTNDLDSIKHVRRMNPVPWVLEFDLNIWTTTLTNKMELLEQIGSIFNPAIELQLSTNPLDWTSLSYVELTGTEFSTRSVPQGTDTELDIAKMSFKTTVYLSLPAIEKRAVLIQQIVDNIRTVNADQDILFNPNEIISQVFTPKNFSIKVNKLSGDVIELYELVLCNMAGAEKSSDGKIYNWKEYLKYLEPEFAQQITSVRFLTSVTDLKGTKGTVISFGTGESRNKIIVEVDNSNYDVQATITKFISDDSEFVDINVGELCCYIGSAAINVDSTIVPTNSVLEKTASGFNVLDIADTAVIYNEQDMQYYRNDPHYGWIRFVLNRYMPGMWKLSFTDK